MVWKKVEPQYEELKPEDFSDKIEELRKNIEKEPDNPLHYYYLAKEFILRVPLRAINSLEDIENLLKKSLELNPNLWAPTVFLGELLYKQSRFKEAEECFRKVIGEKPESVSAREYLAQCLTIDISKIKGVSNEDTLRIFENDLRNFIRKVLEGNLKEDWWRGGIPKKIRATCAARREEGLDEEKDSDLLLFANFYDYKEIIQHNKKFFVKYFNIRKWCTILGEIEPIRNALAHNRPLPNASKKIKEYYSMFGEIMKK